MYKPGFPPRGKRYRQGSKAASLPNFVSASLTRYLVGNDKGKRCFKCKPLGLHQVSSKCKPLGLHQVSSKCKPLGLHQV